MKRTLQVVTFVVFTAQTLILSQSDAAQRVLGEIRTALGGDAKVAAVKSIAIEGQKTNSTADGTSPAEDFEMAIELSGNSAKYVKKEVLANLGGTVIGRRSGFNGAEVIEEVDTPPSMGGGMRVMRMGPGSAMPGGQATPEQIAEQKAQLMVTNRREFARLALGMFGNTTAAYPVEFVYAGQAEAPDGKADVLEVKGPDGFSGKLFVDGKTHLPLMLMWMDKEPLRMMRTMGGAQPAASRGNVQVFAGGAGGGRGDKPQDAAKMQEELAAHMKEAEAARKTVEYRIIYADYKSFDGVRLPTRIQRMTDGVPTEELTLEKIKVNGKIDASKFAIAK